MTKCIGFTYIARRDARLLILGSLPGAESLRQVQYYAKKQNSFWRIMEHLAGAGPDIPYETRLENLMEKRIALWDVCATAERVGSLDSAIRAPEPNDFGAFFKTHKHIQLIAFNGQPAAKLFTRLVLPHLKPPIASIPREILPSTSPAHARMSFEAKLAKWREIIGYSAAAR